MLTRELIENFPEACDLKVVHATLLIHLETMIAIFGESAAMNLIGVMGKDLVVIPEEGHKLLLFAHEGVRVNIRKGKLVCNLREVVISVYKAIEIMKLGFKSQKTCLGAETFAIKRLCLVSTDRNLFPALHWHSAGDDLKEKEIAKDLIKKGRQLMEAVISDGEEFDWV